MYFAKYLVVAALPSGQLGVIAEDALRSTDVKLAGPFDDVNDAHDWKDRQTMQIDAFRTGHCDTCGE